MQKPIRTSALAPHERTFVALDTEDLSQAQEWIDTLKGEVGGYKVGLQLFAAAGPDWVRQLAADETVFLDLKFHDIPNTVAGVAAAVTTLGVDYFTVHALGGSTMIRRAVEATAEAANRLGRPTPRVLGVTVLTSHSDADLDALGLDGPCAAAVERLAEQVQLAGAAGLVCSPAEVELLHRRFPEMELVVPGIRPRGIEVSGDDQSRTASPGETIRRGATRIVVGRPLTGAKDPAAAARLLADDIRANDG
jgi:orotidine-5'-phosphate decarboxylase